MNAARVPAAAVFALAALCVTALAESPAKPPVDIKEIEVRERGDFVFANNAWNTKTPRLQVTFKTRDDVESKSLIARAYFYDKDGN